MSSQPEIAVIYPLIETRGRAVDRVRSWTEQSLDPARYRVIVVTAGQDPVQDREAEGVLRPGDEMFAAPGGRDCDLWNAGVARSNTPWLVITEGHCSADKDCLAAASQWIAANPDGVVGNFEVDHDKSYLGARLAGPWFKSVEARWREPDTWRRIHRSGVIMRSDAFHNAGGFEAEYGQFAAPLLSARLHAAGTAFKDVPGARVLHWDDKRVRNHHYDTADYIYGEFAARFRNDQGFFEQYFEECVAWKNQLRFRRGTAGYALRALCVAAAHHPDSAPSLLRMMQPWAYAMTVGISSRVAIGRAITRVDEFVLERMPMPRNWRYRHFVKAHARAVRKARHECILRRMDRPMTDAAGQSPIDRFDPDCLTGVHAVATHEGRPFRWSEPVVFLRGFPADGEFELRIDTGAIRGDPLPHVIAVVAGGRELPRTFIASDRKGVLTICFPGDWVDAAKKGVVIILSPQCDAEGRWIGLPILSIECAAPGAEPSARDAA
jgi:hypothetical protein